MTHNLGQFNYFIILSAMKNLLSCFKPFIEASSWSSYSTGSQAGIVIGIICLIVLIATVSMIVYRKRDAILISTRAIRLSTGKKSGGRQNVMATVASYQNKQFKADETNIKVAGKFTLLDRTVNRNKQTVSTVCQSCGLER